MNIKTRHAYRFFLCSFALLIIMLLCGCPQKPDTTGIKNGQNYTRDLEALLNNSYETDFSTKDTPVVNINYQLPDGTKRTARFALDGYDTGKGIGYQCVTAEDKLHWEQARNDGDLETPDLNDSHLIQSEAIRYEYPIIFVCVYDYQDEFYTDKIVENQAFFMDELRALLATPEIVQWAKDGGYS